ncbi:MAG: deoxyribodipyrimidine photo-lyase [Puniceicoccaceae bacterium 5H]|nr:MAG: deoxyribodipyrimidine photo-lyase [Puniceicoccaceae bacterium 5H]
MSGFFVESWSLDFACPILVSMSSPTIVWFRQDLRLHDNAALAAALEQARNIVPLYIWAPEEEKDRPVGGASKWWLHHALADLAQQLQHYSLRLIIRQGPTEKALREVAKETGALRIYWNRRYEPQTIQRDSRLKSQLQDDGFAVESFNSSLLVEPWRVAKQGGGPYKVYTPYSKEVLSHPLPDPVQVPVETAIGPNKWPASLELEQLALLPKIPWDRGFYDAWNPTRKGGIERMQRFVERDAAHYEQQRNLPGEDGTSRLSPYLHHGQLGPREVVAALGKRAEKGGGHTFLKELIWREFGYHILYHFPKTPRESLNERFREFPWVDDPKSLQAWQKGQTGYPIVDAGMRQLWQTGWMHNRVRMVVGSLLVKHLLIGWQEGEAWFWDTLVDADLASNVLGWQWVAGSGADAAPYFRIFNPMTQAEKFDPEGAYIRRWVPELAKLPNKYLQAPWTAPANVLEYAGVELGEHYPWPIIDHRKGRQRALDAFERVKKGNR